MRVDERSSTLQPLTAPLLLLLLLLLPLRCQATDSKMRSNRAELLVASPMIADARSVLPQPRR